MHSTFYILCVLCTQHVCSGVDRSRSLFEIQVKWAPPLMLGSAQGFFLLVREFFLATVALGLL